MHVHARLNAKNASRVLFYIPAIDRPSARLSKQEYDDMRACPNIGATAKLPGVLPVYVAWTLYSPSRTCHLVWFAVPRWR